MFNQNYPDFTQAKQWTQGDIQYVDIDLSVARAKPVEINLGGKFLGVDTLAYDDKYTISTTKSVGQAILTLNENQGEPVELTKGIAYDFETVFDRLFVRNVAQSGKMLRLKVSSTVKFAPFSSETTSLVEASAVVGVRVWEMGNNSTFARASMSDTQATIFSSSSSHIHRQILNMGPDTVYISNSTGVTVNTGFPLYAGNAVELRGINNHYGICDTGCAATLAMLSATRT